MKGKASSGESFFDECRTSVSFEFRVEGTWPDWNDGDRDMSGCAPAFHLFQKYAAFCRIRLDFDRFKTGVVQKNVAVDMDNAMIFQPYYRGLIGGNDH